jgi:GT2 family glycosyltransferase/glycosyltransferase involved in cell wall biosynthesis
LNPLYHYAFYGGLERREPGPNFSGAWYYETYPDVKDAGMNPLVHYLRYGKQEGREAHSALTKEDLESIRISALFDQDWYLAHNPDVAEAKVDPLLHYLYVGGFEGRDPGPNFSSKWYLTTYRDVQAAGINPLLHFVKYGIADKRLGHGYFWKRKWGDKIDFAAQIALQAFLDRLNIPLQSKGVLSALKTDLAENRYSQMLEDLFTVDQFLSAPHTDSTTYPLIQTSTLPEITEKSKRRRILFITSQFPNPYHGGGNRVLNFIKILSQNNDIYLSTCFVPEEDASELKEIERYCHSIQTIDHTQYGGNQVAIRAWLNDTQIDIVHYEWPRALENYDPSFGKIQIFTYMEAVSLRLQMDLEKIQPLSTPWLETLAELSYALCLEIAVAAQLTARIAVTTKDADYFKELYPYQAYSILNHGVIFDEFSLPDVESEPHTLVFVGNYKHYPNADAMEFFFNEIWPGVRKAIPDVRIYVVGPNPHERITRFADDQHVIITGGVSDIRSYIQKASIGIAPLISGAGLRGKVIDYAALHRTFVATSIAVTDMAFMDGIDFYCADTAQEFTQKIIDLLQADQLRSQMSASAFNTAQQNYDFYHLTDFLVRLYEHLEKQAAPSELQTQLEGTSDPTSVQAWLSFYEKRVEIPVRSEKDVDGSMWPKVSILILTYNNFLINQLCLKSLYCNTTYPNFEVIVVDNASNDETPRWLNTFAETHPNLKIVLNTENRGFAGGNNQAASLATGEYLIFLNNDTVVTNGWVERLLKYMQSDPKIGLLGPVTNSTGNEARILVNYRSPVEMEAFSDWRARYLAGQTFDIRMLAFYCVMARKDQYDALGGLDERFLVGMFEDDDLAVRYHLQGQRVVCAQDVFIHHFQCASFGKLAISRYAQLFEENKQKYEEKWGRKWEPYQSRQST